MTAEHDAACLQPINPIDRQHGRSAKRHEECRIAPGKRASTTRMPASVLAAIGGGALFATDRGRAVVIGPGAGKGTRSVIVKVAEPRDVIAMEVMLVMPVVMPANSIVGRLRRERGCDQHA